MSYYKDMLTIKKFIKLSKNNLIPMKSLQLKVIHANITDIEVPLFSKNLNLKQLLNNLF